MKIMSKSKEFIAIKVEETKDFYLAIGKYLDSKYYQIKKDKKDCYRFSHQPLVIKVDEREIEVEEGHYILIDTIDDNIKYITEEMYKNDYVELKEE